MRSSTLTTAPSIASAKNPRMRTKATAKMPKRKRDSEPYGGGIDAGAVAEYAFGIILRDWSIFSVLHALDAAEMSSVSKSTRESAKGWFEANAYFAVPHGGHQVSFPDMRRVVIRSACRVCGRWSFRWAGNHEGCFYDPEGDLAGSDIRDDGYTIPKEPLSAFGSYEAVVNGLPPSVTHLKIPCGAEVRLNNGALPNLQRVEDYRPACAVGRERTSPLGGSFFSHGPLPSLKALHLKDISYHGGPLSEVPGLTEVTLYVPAESELRVRLLPPTVRTLKVAMRAAPGSSTVSFEGELPTGLVVFEVGEVVLLGDIPPLPEKLKRLSLMCTSSYVQFGNVLHLPFPRDAFPVSGVSSLPAGLRSLNLISRMTAEVISQLPSGLQSLSCRLTDTIPHGLPFAKSLLHLHLKDIVFLGEGFPDLPNLVSLGIEYVVPYARQNGWCMRFPTRLLPPGLRRMNFLKHNIVFEDPLPAGLRKLCVHRMAPGMAPPLLDTLVVSNYCSGDKGLIGHPTLRKMAVWHSVEGRSEFPENLVELTLPPTFSAPILKLPASLRLLIILNSSYPHAIPAGPERVVVGGVVVVDRAHPVLPGCVRAQMLTFDVSKDYVGALSEMSNLRYIIAEAEAMYSPSVYGR